MEQKPKKSVLKYFLYILLVLLFISAIQQGIAQTLSLITFVCLVCFIAGLFKPSLFNGYFKGSLTRKQTSLYFGLPTVILFLIMGAINPTPNQNDVSNNAFIGNSQLVTESTTSQITQQIASIPSNPLPKLTTSKQSIVALKPTSPISTSSNSSKTKQPVVATSIAQASIQTPSNSSPVVAPVANTTPQPSPPTSSLPINGHVFYVSDEAKKYYYCDDDSQWESLSKANLEKFKTQAAVEAAFPSLVLHRPC